MEAASMIVLGLILILLAVGAAVFSVIASGSTTQTVKMEALGVTVEATPLALYIVGVVSLLLLLLGLLMVNRGAKRKAHARRELKELRKQRAAQPTPADQRRPGVDRGTGGGAASSPEPSGGGSAGAQTVDGGGRRDVEAGSSSSEPPQPPKPR